MHRKGIKVFSSGACAWDVGARVPQKLVLPLRSLSIPIPGQHDGAGERRHRDTGRLYGRGAPGAKVLLGQPRGCSADRSLPNTLPSEQGELTLHTELI